SETTLCWRLSIGLNCSTGPAEMVGYLESMKAVSPVPLIVKPNAGMPHVVDGKNMKMKILVKKDEVDSSRDVQGNPYIIKKQTDTTLIVGDGETIVISGLSRQRTSGGDSGIPWLKDIPGLGYLFKGESKAESKEEVLIFITPHILKPDV
ncbi:MAG TPA: hypothetical protein PLA74_03830, partial [Syntrophales bacterium]|nr:hypothetical protein [Syntrophales bacterium]